MSKSKVKKIENMEYEDFFMDETEGDCLKIFKVTKEKEIKQVVILHSELCWSVNPHTCEVSFLSNPSGISTVDDEGIVHSLVDRFISSSRVNWDELYIMMVGFNLGM